jgi:hypothetical protein
MASMTNCVYTKNMKRETTNLPQADYSVITPYLVPPGIPKRINVGDGFILDSCVKLIGAEPSHVFSSRVPLGEEAISVINASQFVLVAGANTLKDHFEITPGFDLSVLDRIRVPVILCGIGHFGMPRATLGLSETSRLLFRELMARFSYISVRCEASWRYLAEAIPDLADRVLMTSCPVVYPVDGIDHGFVRKPCYRRLVVTVTDRVHLRDQLPLLTVAPQLFPAELRVLALHQDYGNQQLWDFARSQGYEILRSADYQQFLDLYATTDIHFGNRVHAHLKLLSYGVVSFLTPFDLRQQFFADSLDFPLITRLPVPELAEYDFARFCRRREAAWIQMEKFMAAVRRLLHR